MIPKADIVGWRHVAPWISDAQVEQDLIISRALVAIFQDNAIAKETAFRGGTALHKLYLNPARRYSEDIDLVQISSGPIGPLSDALQGVLNPFLGESRRKQAEGGFTLTYRVDSEGPLVIPMRLKIEINTREHFAVMGIKKKPFSVQTRWFNGTCNIPTFSLEELLCTKVRALYQRRKGRDLFDLWLGLTKGKETRTPRRTSGPQAYLPGTPISPLSIGPRVDLSHISPCIHPLLKIFPGELVLFRGK